MSAEPERVIVAKEVLEDFAVALLHAAGFRLDYARQTAELLVWANLRGVDSHGVLRIPRYIEMIEQGIVNGEAEPVVSREMGAIAMVEGDLVPGASGMSLAADKAVALATSFGIGLCSIVRTGHAGAIGYFAERIAKARMVGIVMTASKPLMVYHGSRSEGVSTNPLAICVPAGEDASPLLFDMSTAAVALGKIMAAREAGRAVPPDWGVDAEGRPATDPAKVKAVLPMAGPKGSGLSLMIEILVSVLAGNPLISPALTGAADRGFNGMTIAIDPRVCGAPGQFESEVTKLARAIHRLSPAAGVERVLLPGERGFEMAAERRGEGIPLPVGTVKRLVGEATIRGVRVPPSLLCVPNN